MGDGREAPPERYEIRVGGRLAHRWQARFDGMTLTARRDGTSVLEGPVADQAALHGLLRTLHDLGVPLLSVIPSDGHELADPTAPITPLDPHRRSTT